MPYNILNCVQQMTKFPMEQPNMLFILYCQYHACWCPGELRSQGIIRHGINQISCNISPLVPEELFNIPYITYHGKVVS